MDILQQVMAHKLLYLETKDVVETTLALDNFKRACDCGRGAVFLSVARGKVSLNIQITIVLLTISHTYILCRLLRVSTSTATTVPFTASLVV